MEEFSQLSVLLAKWLLLMQIDIKLPAYHWNWGPTQAFKGILNWGIWVNLGGVVHEPLKTLIWVSHRSFYELLKRPRSAKFWITSITWRPLWGISCLFPSCSREFLIPCCLRVDCMLTSDTHIEELQPEFTSSLISQWRWDCGQVTMPCLHWLVCNIQSFDQLGMWLPNSLLSNYSVTRCPMCAL